MSRLLDNVSERIRTLRWSTWAEKAHVGWARILVPFHAKKHHREVGNWRSSRSSPTWPRIASWRHRPRAPIAWAQKDAQKGPCSACAQKGLSWYWPIPTQPQRMGEPFSLLLDDPPEAIGGAGVQALIEALFGDLEFVPQFLDGGPGIVEPAEDQRLHEAGPGHLVRGHFLRRHERWALLTVPDYRAQGWTWPSVSASAISLTASKVLNTRRRPEIT